MTANAFLAGARDQGDKQFAGESFLLEACPAAGKTIPGLRVAHERLSAARRRARSSRQ